MSADPSPSFAARGRRTHLAAALLCFLLAGFAGAQSADPPARAGRLSIAEGTVSLEPAGTQTWMAAPLNRPLTGGDRLWSEPGARAEVDLGDVVLRLGGSSALALAALDDHVTQLQLDTGSLIVRVRDKRADALYEVDTPNVAIVLLEAGSYRLDVNDRGDLTVVAVREGRAEADGAGRAIPIDADQAFRFQGIQALAFDGGPLPPADGLDDWSAAREHALATAVSASYVPPDTPGTQDLDANGTWQWLPDDGYAWAPAGLPAGWAPYRFGHWAWITPWGWTWIDAAPWGYAPFHYGRWVGCSGARWCWIPGARGTRPVYTPAAVGWLRGRAGIGWFPLAPHEAYVPAVATSAAYLRRVNVANTTVSSATFAALASDAATARYQNNRPGALSATAAAVLVSAAPVNAHALDPAALSGATLSLSAPPLAPRSESVLGGTSAAPVARPPPAYFNRPVLARTPPPHAPAPLERQILAIEASGGHAPSGAELARLQPPAAAAPVRVLPAPRPQAAPVLVAAASQPASGASADLAAAASAPGALAPGVSGAGPRYRPPARSVGSATGAAAPAPHAPQRPASTSHAGHEPDTREQAGRPAVAHTSTGATMLH